jgi:SH3-like domain-containing protein
VTLGEGDTATEVTLKQGDMVFILQAKGEHYRIRKEEGGATGWVKKQYVDGVGGNQSGG